MPIVVSGPNVTALLRSFQAEGISAIDGTQIVTDGAAVFAKCVAAGVPGQAKGLIYGNIQSGKTAVILSLIAIAADNGYVRFVLLTSDLNDLYQQTLDRARNSLHGLTVLGKAELKNPASARTPSPCVLVVSKNVKMLAKTNGVVADQSWLRSSVLIIDDEADQASLDTNVNKPLSSTPSGVNREVTTLRAMFNSVSFVQTTATPQALLLQNSSAAFRPDFVHVTTPGTGYCGGDTFFLDPAASPRHLRMVPLMDVQLLRASGILPQSMETALFTFFVGTAMMRVGNTPTNYQALIHTSLKRAEHQMVTPLIDALTRRILVAVTLAANAATFSSADPSIMAGLVSAFQDFAANVPGPHPAMSEVISEMAIAMPSTSVVEINSNTGQGVQASPTRRHTIYVGGTKLGRGVTIAKLVMTYYARDAQSPQIDTVLQHARMYGYRQRDLPYTRIFLPDHLAERFYQIHLNDNSMRDLARSTGQAIPVIAIPLQGLQASRRNVLSRTSVDLTTFIGGRQYYPLVPISSGAVIAAQTSSLDAALASLCPSERQPYDITITRVCQLLQGIFGQVGSPGAWDDDLVRKAVRLIENNADYGNEAQIIVASRTSQVSKLATRSSVPQIQALLPANAGNPPYGARLNVPVLVFTRLVGAVVNGWDGIPFWVPNIRFPNGNYAFSLNRT